MGHDRDEEPTKISTPAHKAKTNSHDSGSSPKKASAKRFEAQQAHEKQAGQMKTTLYVAADVLKEHRATMIAGAPESAKAGLWELHVAATSKRNGVPIDAAARRSALEASLKLLEPKIAQYRKELEDPEWLSDNVTDRLARLRTDVLFTEAAHRTKTAVRIGEKHIHEETSDPRETGKALHAELPKMIATFRTLDEQMLRIHEHSIKHEAEAMFKGKMHGRASGVASFGDLLGALSYVDGVLLLSDKEFQEHLHHAKSPFDKVTGYTELVKAAVEVSGGALTVAAYVVSRMAKLAGNADVAMKALSVSRMASITLSKCVTIVELVSGALAVVDPDATWGQRLNGAVTVGTSALALAGEKVASANPAALALTGGWELFKWAVSTFYGASVGITSGLMEAPLKVLADRGTTIAHLTSDAINSKLLMEKETDSEKRSALQKVHEVRIYQLQHELDDLIADTSPMSKVAGMAKHPGAHKILNEAFIPLRGFRGATREDVTMQGAALALQRVQFLLSHAPEFRVAAAEGKGWDETAKAVEARDKKPAKGH